MDFEATRGKPAIQFLTELLAVHTPRHDHDRFVVWLTQLDSLDAEWLDDLVDRVVALAYHDTPMQALVTLWSLWPERRHLAHGQLLAAGNPSGAADLDLYDVACLMWTFLDDAATATQFNGRDISKSADLREKLLGMQNRPGGTLAEVDEFRALLNRGADSEPEGTIEGLSATSTSSSDEIDPSHPEQPSHTSS